MTSQRGILAAPVMDEAFGFFALASKTKVILLQMNQSRTKWQKELLWQDWCVLWCADWAPPTICIMTSQRGLTVRREGAFGVLTPTNKGVSFWVSNESQNERSSRKEPRWYDSGVLSFATTDIFWMSDTHSSFGYRREVACEVLTRPRPSEATWLCKANKCLW